MGALCHLQVTCVTVSFPWLLQQRIPQTLLLGNNTTLLSYSSGGEKSKTESHWAEIKAFAGLVHLAVPGGEPRFCHFHFPDAPTCPGCTASSSTCNSWSSLPHSRHADAPVPVSYFRFPCEHRLPSHDNLEYALFWRSAD